MFDGVYLIVLIAELKMIRVVTYCGCRAVHKPSGQLLAVKVSHSCLICCAKFMYSCIYYIVPKNQQLILTRCMAL